MVIMSLSMPDTRNIQQRRVVVKVEQLLALVDPLETQLAASLGTAVDLLNAT